MCWSLSFLLLTWITHMKSQPWFRKFGIRGNWNLLRWNKPKINLYWYFIKKPKESIYDVWWHQCSVDHQNLIIKKFLDNQRGTNSTENSKNNSSHRQTNFFLCIILFINILFFLKNKTSIQNRPGKSQKRNLKIYWLKFIKNAKLVWFPFWKYANLG